MNDKARPLPADFFSQFSDVVISCSKMQADALQECSRVQLEFMNLCMEYNLKQVQRLSVAENPADVVAAESDVTMEYMNRFYDNGLQMFEALGRLQNRMLDWMASADPLPQPNATEAGSRKPAAKTAQTGA